MNEWMNENEQISHIEEFQILFVPTPFLRRRPKKILTCKVCAAHSGWLLSKEYSVKMSGGGGSKFTVEKCENHYLQPHDPGQ